LISAQFKNVFPELHAQEDFVATSDQRRGSVSSLRTLHDGIVMFEVNIIDESYNQILDYKYPNQANSNSETR
jgi:hypothetical protein